MHESDLVKVLALLGLDIGSFHFDLQMDFISNSVVLNRSDGTARFVKEAPDTITSWVITAFSIDTFHGLGVIEQPTKVCSFFRFLVINFFFGE